MKIIDEVGTSYTVREKRVFTRVAKKSIIAYALCALFYAACGAMTAGFQCGEPVVDFAGTP